MKRVKITPALVICCFIALLMAVVALFPLVWMFLSSFKPKTQVLAVPMRLFPETWTLDNYVKIFSDGYTRFFRSLLMTFIAAALGVFASLSFNMMASYVFARMRFYGKKFLWAYCIATMYVPGMTILITSFLMVSNLGMLDTIWVLVLPGATGGYSIFFFRQFFLNMPASLEEAALIDGCGRFRIFLRIFIPLSIAPMVVHGAGCFLGYWNAFLWPAITITKPELMQVMQIIRMLTTSYGNDNGAIMAGTSVAVVVPIILFCIFQKYIVQGFVLSGLK